MFQKPKDNFTNPEIPRQQPNGFVERQQDADSAAAFAKFADPIGHWATEHAGARPKLVIHAPQAAEAYANTGITQILQHLDQHPPKQQ